MSARTRYAAYRRRVQELTAATGIHERKGAGTVDHIVPIRRAFNWDIPAELIGSPENLQVLPHQSNLKKGQSIDDKGCALLRKWGYEHRADAVEAMRVAA